MWPGFSTDAKQWNERHWRQRADLGPAQRRLELATQVVCVRISAGLTGCRELPFENRLHSLSGLPLKLGHDVAIGVHC